MARVFPRKGLLWELWRSRTSGEKENVFFFSFLSEPRADMRAGLSSSTDSASDTLILYLLLWQAVCDASSKISACKYCTWWVYIHPIPAPDCSANHLCPGFTVSWCNPSAFSTPFPEGKHKLLWELLISSLFLWKKQMGKLQMAIGMTGNLIHQASGCLEQCLQQKQLECWEG